MPAGLIRPTGFDIAVGASLGLDGEAPETHLRGARVPTPRRTLEELVLKCLLRPPCVVDFSGGRDSSLVLAVATHVARREGLASPVPYTRRFPEDAATDEDQWQEQVIAHLGLDHWERATFTDELDLIGPRAQAFLNRYGLLLPSTLYVVVGSFEVARGGSHLTGEGGDEVLRPAPGRKVLSDLTSARTLKQPRLLVSTLAQAGPAPVRTARLQRRYARSSALPGATWLRPEAFVVLARLASRHFGSQPLGWRAYLGWYLRQRFITAHRHNLGIISADYDVLHVDPLLDLKFVAALGEHVGMGGPPSRHQAMEDLAVDLLPKALIERQSKATFNTVYFSAATRGFAQQWAGQGVDLSLVDPERLRAEWLKTTPAGPSSALLQSAWLSQRSAHVPPLGT